LIGDPLAACDPDWLGAADAPAPVALDEPDEPQPAASAATALATAAKVNKCLKRPI
jgi:hypothetical protein